MILNGDFVRREKRGEARESGDFGGFKNLFRICTSATRSEDFPILSGGVVVAKCGTGESEARATMCFVIKVRKFK